MEIEISAILIQYFSGHTTSRTYWPRALRAFLVALLEELLKDTPGMLAAIKVEEYTVRKLAQLLAKSTTTHIGVSNRKLTHTILLGIQSHDKSAALLGTLRSKLLWRRSVPPAATATPSWPSDVIECEDLQESFSSCDLSSDTKAYLHNIVSSVDVV